MYDPVNIKNTYDKMEHGKVKIAAMRSAVAEADRQGDVTYGAFFREEICHESCFYGEGMDMMIIFPELLALVDKHPETPTTIFDKYIYQNSLDHVLWIYKWVLSHCESYYQIPMEDCMNFFQDAKERFLRFGYNLKPWYLILYDFYKHIDKERAEKDFYEFERLPRDSNSDCQACERNTEISFYLDQGNLEKAVALSKEIENFKLTCGDKMSAWLRMKKHFMHYYMKRREFDKALDYCRMMERNLQEETEFERWDDFLVCYAHSDLGKALKIYKEHWKEWQEWRDPSDEFRVNVNACLFFRELGKSKEGKEQVKLPFDNSFPLYRESGQYGIQELYDFYYKKASDLAEKFDARNGADGYRKELEEALCITP